MVRIPQKGTCLTWLVRTDTILSIKWHVLKIWKQPKYSQINEWEKKMWHTDRIEYGSVIKKDEILPFEKTWMDPRGYYTK